MPINHLKNNTSIINEVEKLEQQYNLAVQLLRMNRTQDQAAIKIFHEQLAPQFSKREFIFHTMAKCKYLKALATELKKQADSNIPVDLNKALKSLTETHIMTWPVFVDGINQLLQSNDFKKLKMRVANLNRPLPKPPVIIARPLPKPPVIARALPPLPMKKSIHAQPYVNENVKPSHNFTNRKS